MTTGALQTLARANRVSPGRQVIVAGTGRSTCSSPASWWRAASGGGRAGGGAEAGVRAWREALRLAASAPDLAWDGAGYLAVLRAPACP
jgi:hypothetical protein